MIDPGVHILVDTNVVIEAHRTRCWKALLGRYKLDSVEQCLIELASGNQMRRGYVPVDADEIRSALRPKSVTEKQRAEFQSLLANRVDLDPGESDLLAYARTLPAGTYFLCSPDRPALWAMRIMGVLDQAVSLEELVEGTGADPPLQEQYRKKWLAREKIKIRLEVL